MINQVRLADDTIMERTTTNKQKGSLWVYCFDNVKIESVGELLSDHEKTAVIIDIQPEEEIEYIGYTVMNQLLQDPCGCIIAEMKKPE